MALIETRHLTKVFYPARTSGAWVRAPWTRRNPVIALERVSLTIERGELFCFMGSNGAGKTTLLKILAGLLLPTSGIVLINAHDSRHHSLRLRAQIGFASGERPGFYDRLTGRQNLTFFASLYGLSGSDAKRRIAELLELFEVETPDQQYQEYSTGIKQRLLLARALLHDPPILLLDEPTRSLDPVQTTKLHDFIKDRLHHAMGKTILFTTHQVWEAAQLAGRVAVLHRGSIRGCGMIDDLARGSDLGTVVNRLCGAQYPEM